MAAAAIGRHLEKSKNRHIFATVPLILTKFGMATHFDPLKAPTVENSEFCKSKMVATVVLENRGHAISRCVKDGSCSLSSLS